MIFKICTKEENCPLGDYSAPHYKLHVIYKQTNLLRLNYPDDRLSPKATHPAQRALPNCLPRYKMYRLYTNELLTRESRESVERVFATIYVQTLHKFGQINRSNTASLTLKVKTATLK